MRRKPLAQISGDVKNCVVELASLAILCWLVYLSMFG